MKSGVLGRSRPGASLDRKLYYFGLPVRRRVDASDARWLDCRRSEKTVEFRVIRETG